MRAFYLFWGWGGGGGGTVRIPVHVTAIPNLLAATELKTLPIITKMSLNLNPRLICNRHSLPVIILPEECTFDLYKRIHFCFCPH